MRIQINPPSGGLGNQTLVRYLRHPITFLSSTLGLRSLLIHQGVSICYFAMVIHVFQNTDKQIMLYFFQTVYLQEIL